jgi:NAD(P)H-dependent FMN reductase
MRILIFPGSRRRQSLNGLLAVMLGSMLEQTCDVDILEPSDVDLPVFNEDLEHDPDVRCKVEAIYERFLAADGLIVASPEYNGSITPYLKNTVDWVSRLARVAPEQGFVNPFQNKPLLLASATAGWSGGVLGLQAARSMFSYLGCLILAECLALPFARDAWDADGSLIDLQFMDLAASTLDRLQVLARNSERLERSPQTKAEYRDGRLCDGGLRGGGADERTLAEIQPGTVR